jgi:hypothetical protein
MKVVPTSNYERRAKKLLIGDQRAAMELELVARWDGWPVIPGTGGARKARFAMGGKGKSGGGRVVYFVPTSRGVLYLLDIYAKRDKEDLSDAEKNALRRALEALEAEG